MGSQYVMVGERTIYVGNDRLDLSMRGIKDISEIKGLETLTNLTSLRLSWNQIPQALRKQLGNDAQSYVEYCKKKL